MATTWDIIANTKASTTDAWSNVSTTRAFFYENFDNVVIPAYSQSIHVYAKDAIGMTIPQLFSYILALESAEIFLVAESTQDGSTTISFATHDSGVSFAYTNNTSSVTMDDSYQIKGNTRYVLAMKSGEDNLSTSLFYDADDHPDTKVAWSNVNLTRELVTPPAVEFTDVASIKLSPSQSIYNYSANQILTAIPELNVLLESDSEGDITSNFFTHDYSIWAGKSWAISSGGWQLLTFDDPIIVPGNQYTITLKSGETQTVTFFFDPDYLHAPSTWTVVENVADPS